MPTTVDESAKSESGQSISITVRDQPLTIDFDPAKMGDGVAIAIAKAVGNGIKAITEMSQDGKHRAFNKTGVLANGITVEPAGTNKWSVVAPEGYLEDDKLFDKLVALVPVIDDPLSDAGVQAATLESLMDAITIGFLKG